MPTTHQPNIPMWEKLPDLLLTPAGKAIVSGDPNLGEDTLAALTKTEAGVIRGVEWNLERSDDLREMGLGYLTLSLCIDDKPDANMAELVAMYAKLRNTSFVETAQVLCELRKSGALYHYSTATATYVPWEPRIEYPAGNLFSERPPAKTKQQQ